MEYELVGVIGGTKVGFEISAFLRDSNAFLQSTVHSIFSDAEVLVQSDNGAAIALKFGIYRL